MKTMAYSREIYLGTKEIMRVIGCKRTKASQIVTKLNRELQKRGYETNLGMVSRTYFCERYGISDDALSRALAAPLVEQAR